MPTGLASGDAVEVSTLTPKRRGTRCDHTWLPGTQSREGRSRRLTLVVVAVRIVVPRLGEACRSTPSRSTWVSSGHRVRPGLASSDADVGERVGRVPRARSDHVDGAPPRGGERAGGVGHNDTDTCWREPVDHGAHRRRARRHVRERADLRVRLTAAWETSRGTIPWDALSLAGATLPTFLAPPENAAELVVYHTSCRKPHGGGRDGLSLALTDMDTRFQGTAPQPHLLVMSGDQIYADEVGHPLMPRVLRVAKDVIRTRMSAPACRARRW